ncbi:MAG: gephyrin-like molybdotransferase Glp [Desulfuromonadales bacterium]|nr:gephyrin-like molybdotransferase Glp [Desulfuromonadales bacterium]
MPISFSDARQLILEQVPTLGVERVMLLAAAGRILAEEVISPCDLPDCDVSAMDGYAIHAADCQAGTLLRVTGFIAAGGSPTPVVTAGSAVKIMTGAALPAGCDAVVPVEVTQEEGGFVRILTPVSRHQYIRRRGEDVAQGTIVIPCGTLIRPPEISMLASLGRLSIAVHRRPRVAIVSTGDELVEPGEARSAGQIVNSNAYSLAAAVQECGAEALLLGIARDDLDSHRRLFSAGLDCDVLITSAGVSAGDRDLVREVLAELGVQQFFWKIAMKPGGPTAFGIRGQVPVFSLPGNPVSTMVTFEELVRPALLQMMGHRRVLRPLLKAILQEEIRKEAGKTLFMRVQVTLAAGRFRVSTSGDQRTSTLRTMVRANGLAILPADATVLAAGSEVDLHLLNDEVVMLDPFEGREPCP